MTTNLHNKKVKFINVRGTNGSGKTTLLRAYVESVPGAKVLPVPAPLDPTIAVKHAAIFATLLPNGVALLGDYVDQTATTAGCDRIKTQALAKYCLETISRMSGVRVVIFEGIVVSTIFGPWLEWSRANGGMVWAYLDTPLQVCLDRIQARNGGKPIKEDLVKDKDKSITRTLEKAIDEDEATAIIPYVKPVESLMEILEIYFGID